MTIPKGWLLVHYAFIDNAGVFHQVNEHDYEHCNHHGFNSHRVVRAWGNVTHICDGCGEVTHKEYTPTS